MKTHLFYCDLVNFVVDIYAWNVYPISTNDINQMVFCDIFSDNNFTIVDSVFV